MEARHSRQYRAEHLIAAGRLALAAVSLFAVWLDPAQPSRYGGFAYALLVLYLGYAAALFALASTAQAPTGRNAIIAHGADLGVASLVMLVTEGPGSPFFAYFVFALVAGTLRWQARGALWTAIASLVAFCALGLAAALHAAPGGFELPRFLIRGSYLAVTAVLLGYLGAHGEALRGDLARLASWPLRVSGSRDVALAEALEQAAFILRAPRVALAWEEGEEPWLHLATWSAGRLERSRHAPGQFEPLAAEPLAGSDFLCADGAAAEGLALVHGAAGFFRWRGGVLHPELAARLGAGPTVAVTLGGPTLTGRFFALGREDFTTDDLTLAHVVARQTEAHLDQVDLVEHSRTAAVSAERVRIARNLHDGVVQGLAAAGLKLDAARALVVSDPQAAAIRMVEVQELLAEEQKGLRTISRGLGPGGVTRGGEVDLDLHLRTVCERVATQWEVAIDYEPLAPGERASEALAEEASRIVHEALVNAARHGRAAAAKVGSGRRGTALELTIIDDGRGFPFAGVYDLPALAAQGLGPVALRERVGALGGTLQLATGSQGVSLTITLPLPSQGA